jgi:hypothetical protein
MPLIIWYSFHLHFGQYPILIWSDILYSCISGTSELCIESCFVVVGGVLRGATRFGKKAVVWGE